jgi:hypothetical protein
MLSRRLGKLATTDLWKITHRKSASVYECFPLIWPYNAQTAEMAIACRLEVAFEAQALSVATGN